VNEQFNAARKLGGRQAVALSGLCHGIQNALLESAVLWGARRFELAKVSLFIGNHAVSE
jgi:hypothetical protein